MCQACGKMLEDCLCVLSHEAIHGADKWSEVLVVVQAYLEVFPFFCCFLCFDDLFQESHAVGGCIHIGDMDIKDASDLTSPETADE